MENFLKFPLGKYLLENNAHGYPGGDVPQSIAPMGEFPAGVKARWEWRHQNPNPDRVVAYPEIIYGKKPWHKPHENSDPGVMPRRVGDCHSILANFQQRLQGATGVYNSAFELWLTAGAPHGESDIRAEIMVWVRNQGMNAGQYGGPGHPSVAFSDGQRSSRLYWDVTHMNMGWDYYAYVLDQPLDGGTLELQRYLQHACAHARTLGRDYGGCFVASIEFGNEVINGNCVQASLSGFSVDVF